ncbi:MAG: TonB-dependent receptor plug domain-containing protein [Saprospiraceae bacterium]
MFKPKTDLLYRIAHNWLLAPIFSLAGITAQAQVDSTARMLPEVAIVDARQTRTGYSAWNADSLPTTGTLSLAERLHWEVPLGVRINAPGTLATVSARGAGPSRTAVFWQGLNLQSPMHGVVDVSLVPLWPDDRLHIQYGGQSAAQGSGSMGGAVHIRPAAPENTTGWTIQAGGALGSFGRKEMQASIRNASKYGYALIRAAGSRSDNDFSYQNTTQIGRPWVRQANNFSEKLDLQQFNQLKINEKNTFETAVWYQTAFREIPPAMTEAPSQTWQRDRALRAVATWTAQSSPRTQWQHRAAWLDEYIAFFRPGDTDTSRSRTLLLGSEYITAPTQNFALRANLTGWHQQAQADGYTDSTAWFFQKRLAGTLGGEYRWRKFQLSAHFRQEWAEGQGAPFTWMLGGQWAGSSELTVRLHLARTFNLPTFNDRFWLNLGKPDLKPESGHSAEAGLVWKRSTFALETSVFHLLLDDWILWQPGSDGQFRPGNLRRVWSRGLEISVQDEVLFWRSRWRLSGRYQFVCATNTAVYDANAGVLGKLLPYTPEHSASGKIIWSHGAWSAAYLHQWTGPRFGNADNSQTLPDFSTGNLLVQYTAAWGKHQVNLNVRVENCWDAPYQVIAFRPMPGRAWRVGVEYSQVSTK